MGKPSSDLLEVLHGNAAAWARTYTRLVEALLMEGVPEKVAREEARQAATLVFCFNLEDNDAPGLP